MAPHQHGSRQRRGRGAYYAAKYGNHELRNGHSSANSMSYTPVAGRDEAMPAIIGDLASLSDLLKSLDNLSYSNYKSLRGTWKLSPTIFLIFDYIQGDPYASPSYARIRVPLSATGFSECLFSSNIRIVALCDYLARKFAKWSLVFGLERKRNESEWLSVRGGDIFIDCPKQHVLPRTSCVLDGDTLELRVAVMLPARGRTIKGRLADQILTEALPPVLERVLFAQPDDAEICAAHVQSVDEQEELRGRLADMGLIAFVVDGAVLPRAAGDSDLPLQGSDVVLFKSPDSLAVDVQLSNGRQLRGMGVRPGISLIVGGGFHGKSTLLSALQVGIYNHIPGDGRCFVSVVPETVAIRAEDGRSVVDVDISPFITNLPFSKSTESFTTTKASGSTSQAANIIEALDVGAKVLLIDEDLSATNFMMRDSRMYQLVPQEKEPITPMIQRIRTLFEQNGVSCILVIGGSGDYFEVSDTVVMMDSYVPLNVTKKAKKIAKKNPSGLSLDASHSDVFKSTHERKLCSQSLQEILSGGKGRILSKRQDIIEAGKETIDLSAVVQLVESSQTKAIAAAIERLGEMTEVEMEGVEECMDKICREIDEKGLDSLDVRGKRLGTFAQPRKFEIYAALNRLRGLRARN